MENPSTNPAQRRRRRRRPQGSGESQSPQANPQSTDGGQRKQTSPKRPKGSQRAEGRPRGQKRGGNASRNNRRPRSGQGPSSGTRSRSRAAHAEPSQWEKFLSLITFGLLGKAPKKGGASSKTKGGKGGKGLKGSKGGSAKATRRPAAGEGEAPPEFTPAKRHVSASTTFAHEEVTTKRLYVGNLNFDATEDQLEELFRGVGNVVDAEVATHSRTQQSKGFAYVEMGSLDEARRAVETLDNQEFLGRRIEVSGAREEADEIDEIDEIDEADEADEAEVPEEAQEESGASAASA